MTKPGADTSQNSLGVEHPSPEVIRATLAHIFDSSEFNRSARLQRFLTYIVEETLAGRGNALKEYTIALEVFDREPSFDPQTSSIVRVEANRLRSKLEKYNVVYGRDDPVTISLPPGRYVPNFQAELGGAQQSTASQNKDGPPYSATKRRVAVVCSILAVVGISLGLIFNFFDLDHNAKIAAPHTFAVLPLRNLSGKPDEEYLSDGMTEMLITGLAKISSIRVVSMSSVMAYKNIKRPISDIARELNASHIITGSILKDGRRLRITVQLIEAEADKHLWAESYETDMSHILSTQNDVARRVMGSLAEKPNVFTINAPLKITTVSPEAQEDYLRGRYFRNQMTEDGFRKAINYFKKVIKKAPDYAEAYSGMAACYCLLGGHGFELVEPRLGMPSAKSAVLEALRLNDTLPEAHAFLGIIRLKYEWDWSGAEKAFLRAIELNPSYAQARIFYSFFLEAMGRQEQAIREATIAQSIDPLSLPANMNLGWQFLRSGRLENALQQLNKTRELRSDFWGVHWGFGHFYRRMGDYDQAIKAFEKAVEVGGGYTLPMTDLGYTYGIAGRHSDARKMLAQLKTMSDKSYVSPYNIAVIHVGLGEIDDAFVWLDKAFESRSRSLAWLRVATEFDGLRSDPRFRALLKRIGL